MGDPSGIGPEVIAKAFAAQRPALRRRFLVLGDSSIMSGAKAALKLPLTLNRMRTFSPSSMKEGAMNLIDFENVPRQGFSYGCEDRRYGKASVEYMDAALDLLGHGKASALVTGPVNKSSITRSGIAFFGHTEYMAEKTKTKRFAMMLLGGRLRVTLVTRHVALKDVSRILSIDLICRAIELTYEALTTYFGIASPTIGVAGVNPHAGDFGLFGTEEEDVVIPAIRRASRRIAGLCGPRPPDAIFYEAHRNKYDAVVAMYHDQGLIPLKMLYFDEGVNLTLGLPFIRTSPDHGTAFDIAGRGIASSRSMCEAMKLALELSGS